MKYTINHLTGCWEENRTALSRAACCPVAPSPGGPKTRLSGEMGPHTRTRGLQGLPGWLGTPAAAHRENIKVQGEAEAQLGTCRVSQSCTWYPQSVFQVPPNLSPRRFPQSTLREVASQAHTQNIRVCPGLRQTQTPWPRAHRMPISFAVHSSWPDATGSTQTLPPAG